MKVLGAHWFSDRTHVGVVCYKTALGKVEYKISSVPGDDEQEDIMYVLNWGTKFPDDAGKVLFGAKK